MPPIVTQDEITHALTETTIPSPSRQAAYFASGALAGLCGPTALQVFTTLTTIHRLPNPKNLKPLLLSPGLPKAGLRFWTVDQVRARTAHTLHASLGSTLGGAAAGFLEESLHALGCGKRPVARTVISQTLRLGVCFGIVTHLGTRLTPDSRQPRPFWWYWGLGAVAGAVGNGLASGVVDGVRGRGLVLAVPRGAVLMGTVVSVQVTSCAGALGMLGE